MVSKTYSSDTAKASPDAAKRGAGGDSSRTASDARIRPQDNAATRELVERQQRMLQAQRERDKALERSRPSQETDEKSKALQTGHTAQPEGPLPDEQLDKPGQEADMSPRPGFEAKGYRGSGKLEGMKALITGGDSGIGRAVAVLFAREGADVAISYLNEHDDAHETAEAVRREGRQCLLLPGSILSRRACEELVERSVSEFGGLDILVNNAAFQLHANDIEELDDERIGLTLETNVMSAFRMARAAVPHLRKGGSILNTGSVAGLRGSKGLLDYSTTKGALHTLTKALASSLIERGIRVNAVAPGPVWTPLNPADKPPEMIENFGSSSDIGRAAQPEELAPAYVFLASPSCASYITGVVLPVTGSVGAI